MTTRNQGELKNPSQVSVDQLQQEKQSDSWKQYSAEKELSVGWL